MASSSSLLLCFSQLITRGRHCIIIFLLSVSFLFHGANGKCYTAIFSFGDSLADTGNAIRSGSMPPTVGKLPYGKTYFKRATGRFSDGRIIVDFIAQALGLPLLRPYLEGGDAEDFHQGANFAVASATALNNNFFKEKGYKFGWKDYSLGVQIQWFKTLLKKFSSNKDYKDILSNSLILMGEIGGNDYNYAFSSGRTFDEIQTYVPSVVGEIISGIKVLIGLGAKTIMVPGNLPIGCAPCYLSDFKGETDNDYDPETGCLHSLNEFSEYHNDMLLKKLDRLQKRYPEVMISYADYYEASMSVFRSSETYGFKSPLVACCGAGGKYNFDWSTWCGNEGSKVCNDSSTAFYWDGVHLTEAGSRVLAKNLLERSYIYPPFQEECLTSKETHDEL